MSEIQPVPQIVTVTGPLSPDDAGITDAHNHLWVGPVPGAIQIIPKMKQLGFSPETIRNLAGGNIARRLARPSEQNG